MSTGSTSRRSSMISDRSAARGSCATDYSGRAKLVVDRATDTLVGATFVGSEVAELLHSATTAIVGKVTLETLWHAVPSFPTVSEVWLRLLESRRSSGVTLRQMPLTGPPPISFNPLRRLTGDLLAERRAEVPFPPGETSFSIRRTRGFALTRCRCCSTLRALRAGVHDARVPRQHRVHDRARGQPLHDGLAREQLQLARGPHGRPDRAAGTGC